MFNYAPVLIPTLNRYEHFKRCVESLSKCTHADKTVLYIALDYPSDEAHWEGYNKINNFLPNIRGFKEVIIIKRDENFGVRKNINDARLIIYEKFDRSIFSEDDNEFSPNFLDYINKGLIKFENDEKVIAICGYNFSIEIPESNSSNYYYYKAHNAWGYATWRDRNLKLVYTTEEVRKLMNNRKFLIQSFQNFGFSKLFKLINLIMLNKSIDGDRAITTTLLKENKYCVFPTISKVKNHGHDGSGVHCNYIEDSVFKLQMIDLNTTFEYSDSILGINKVIQIKIRNYFKLSIKNKIKFLIQYFYFSLENLKLRLL